MGLLGRLLVCAILLLCGGAQIALAAKEAHPAGYASAQMQRGPQNHLILRAMVNGRPASFLIDTGSTISFLRSDHAEHFGVRSTSETTTRGGRTFPLAIISKLEVGGTSLGQISVALTVAAYLRGTAPGSGATDGVLGLDLLRREKAIINCHTREIFFKTDPTARLDLSNTTRALGFARISLEERRAGDLTVACRLRGRNGRLVVDTGAFVTGIDDDAARLLGLTTKPSKLTSRGLDGRVRSLQLAQIDDLQIGGIAIAGQPFAVMDLFGEKKELRTHTGLGRIEYYEPRSPGAEVFGVLGNELLDHRRAIIDLENMILYFK